MMQLSVGLQRPGTLVAKKSGCTGYRVGSVTRAARYPGRSHSLTAPSAEDQGMV